MKDLSIFSHGQQDVAMNVAIARIGDIGEDQHENPVKARMEEVGMDLEVMVELYEANLPDEDGSDPRSLCEGVLLGIAFTLELLEG